MLKSHHHIHCRSTTTSTRVVVIIHHIHLHPIQPRGVRSTLLCPLCAQPGGEAGGEEGDLGDHTVLLLGNQRLGGLQWGGDVFMRSIPRVGWDCDCNIWCTEGSTSSRAVTNGVTTGVLSRESLTSGGGHTCVVVVVVIVVVVVEDLWDIVIHRVDIIVIVIILVVVSEVIVVVVVHFVITPTCCTPNMLLVIVINFVWYCG